jgi:hypothetical protein
MTLLFCLTMSVHCHFSWPILPKLVENVEYDKNRIPLFFKVKTTKIFACEYFQVF